MILFNLISTITVHYSEKVENICCSFASDLVIKSDVLWHWGASQCEKQARTALLETDSSADMFSSLIKHAGVVVKSRVMEKCGQTTHHAAAGAGSTESS